MFNLTKKPVYLALIFALSGCGGGGGGSSGADNSTVALSGKVVDGYINNATVFCDSNKDSIQNNGEASTTTSGQGDFTFSPACNTTLVSIGGTDIATGYIFKGILKAPVGATILSPLTTLLADSGLTNAQLVLALSLAEGTDLTKIDPAAPGNSAILKKTLAVQQIVQQLANLMASQSNPNALGKLYSIVAASLARTLLASPTATLFDINGNINTALLTDTIQKTLDTINNDGTLKSVTFTPADIASIAAQVSEQAAQFSKASDAANLSELAKTLQDPQAAPLEIPSLKTYYISPKNDSVIVNSTPYSLSQFTNTGITVAGLASIGFEYTATPGTQVDVVANVGMAIQEVGGQGRVLQVKVEQVRIERNPASGFVILSLTPQTNVYVYAKDNRGNEMNVTVAKPSFNPVTIVNNAVTINYANLVEKVVGNTAYNTSTFIPSQFSNLTGIFKTKFVVSSNLNVRYQDGTPLTTLNVGITNTSQIVTGPGAEGTVNIQ